MWKKTAFAAATCVAVVALFSIVISPWYEVANHPVRLTLQAPVDAIDLCWMPDACEHFVRKPDTQDVWLAELPPNAIYNLRLYFQNGVPMPAKARITVFNTNDNTFPISPSVARPLMDQVVDIPPIAAHGEVEVGAIEVASRNLSSAAIVFAVLISLATGVALVIRSLLRRASPPKVASTSILPIILIAVAATIVHVILVHSFPILYLLGSDSDDYLKHALNLLDYHQYRISGRDAFGETVRTPGYALFLAGILSAFGRHLSAVTLVQSVLFMASVSALALALRRCASPAFLGAFVVIAAIMPPDIDLSRSILSDGAAATFALFSVAAFIEAELGNEKSRTAMMWTGAVAAAIAVLVRPTTVVVLIIPGLTALQDFIAAWPTSRWQSFRAAIPALWLIAPTIAAALAWSTYNRVQHKYFGVSNYAETVKFAGRMDTGTFDVRSLAYDDASLRRAYLVDRERAGYWQYHIHLIPPIQAHFVKNRRQSVNQINAGISEVIDRSDRLNPWQLKAIRILRGIWWAAFLPPEQNYNGFPFEFQILKPNITPDQVHRAFPSVNFDTPEPTTLFDRYMDWSTMIYNTARPVVYLLALLSAYLSLYLGSWMLASPMLVHTANLLVHVQIGVVYCRYVQVLDTMLFVQIAIGLTLIWNSQTLSRQRLQAG
jgi:hypothetical protein